MSSTKSPSHSHLKGRRMRTSRFWSTKDEEEDGDDGGGGGGGGGDGLKWWFTGNLLLTFADETNQTFEPIPTGNLSD